MPSCGVRLSRSYILSKRIGIFEISSQLIDSGSHTILVFAYQTSRQYSDVNPLTGASNAGACGRQKSRFWANNWLHRMLWTLRRPAAINTIVGRYLAIDRCLLELVLSPDVRPSIGVSQSRCKSVYGTESHAPVNTPKRIEQFNLRSGISNARVQLIIEDWQIRSIARPLCDSRATCILIISWYSIVWYSRV